ncbi:hypothetical protein AB0M45_22605 [Nocardia sp. NPDC051787]|uniref:hypothetical protein n=1 Tax=Nocardia sp. NPDC051787 TaxID=3155415 RepID=UPI00341B3A00
MLVYVDTLTIQDVHCAVCGRWEDTSGMNRKYRPSLSLFSHLEEPAATSEQAGAGVVCRPVFSSAVSGAAAADDAAAAAGSDQ